MLISQRYLRLAAAAAVLLVVGNGCQGTRDKIRAAIWSGLGYEKRDLLVESVEEARDSQGEAKEEFKSALEKFSALINFDGGELGAKYKELNRAYESSSARAQDVSDRISRVERDAAVLFQEWEKEIGEYQRADFRAKSEEMLRQSKGRYESMLAAMKRAESKIAPVLTAFSDQVKFLKHSLNAKAVAALQDELVSIESDVAALVAEMEAAINEADEFIQSEQSEAAA